MRRAVPLLLCRRATRGATLLAVMATPRVAVLASFPRWCSSKPAAPSAVNVEEFTLNEEVVKQDLENMSKWNDLSAALEAAREAGDHTSLLAEVEKGLQLLAELGENNAPIQCECLLCMEASQAHYNTKDYDKAQSFAERAKDSLVRDCKPELQDKAQVAEINHFIGFILCKQGKAKEAHALFTEVLNWIDVDAKGAMPMQAVAAVNLRRNVITGQGHSLMLQAEELARKEESAESRELYGKALDILIEALNQHIDENDFELVKSTLSSILTCFEGLDDVSQAVTTCRKYVSWCSRHDDEEGVAQGEKILEELCARHGVENPIKAEKKEG